MSVDEFIQKYNGKTKGYPNDNFYWGECLSIVKLWIKEGFGIDPPPSGSNSAAGYWYNFPNPLGSVFNKVANTPSGVPKKGDIIIWAPTSTNPYGHIAIFVEGNASSFRSFDQNYGGKQAHIQGHYYNNVLGWLTPKEGDMDKFTPGQTTRLYQIIADRDPENEAVTQNRGWEVVEGLAIEKTRNDAEKKRRYDEALAIIKEREAKVSELETAKQNLIQGSIQKEAMIKSLQEHSANLEKELDLCRDTVDEADQERIKAIEKAEKCAVDLDKCKNSGQGNVELTRWQRIVDYIYKLIGRS